MSEESDEGTSELDAQNRTWDKLEKSMRLLGFREGAVEGKKLSLQKGFNLGFIDGFQLGECLGISKGVIGSEAELQLSPNKKTCIQDETLDKLTNHPCVLCLEERNLNKTSFSEVSAESFESIISSQQSHSNKIISTLKKFSPEHGSEYGSERVRANVLATTDSGSADGEDEEVAE